MTESHLYVSLTKFWILFILAKVKMKDGKVVKVLFGIPTSYVRMTDFNSLFLIQLIANALTARHPVMAQVFGSLPLMWETQVEFQAVTPAIVGVWGVNQQSDDFLLCLSNINLKKIIIKSN